MYDQETEKSEEELLIERQKEQLRAFIAQRRDEAVNARRASGIERRWQEDEEYYEGVDDLNRSEDGYMKPSSGDGGLVSRAASVDDRRCTAFFNITRPFVDAASSRFGDMLLPANDWNFRIKPTPIPEFDDHIEDETRVPIVGPDGQPLKLGEVIQERNKDAAEKIRKAEKRVRDWLVECHYREEFRKVIDDCALAGTGILKGPFPVKRTTRRFDDGVFQMVEQMAPASQRIRYWDFFPDPSCGENIHDGSYVIERDYLTARQLANLRGMPDGGYIDEAIDKVLKEGPGKRNLNAQNERDRSTQEDDRFEIWYYYGDISRRELAMVDDDCECPEDGSDNEPVPVVVAMVNDTIIKGYSSPIESGEFPFDVMLCQRMAGSPFGVGISRQGRTAQKMVLSAARALMDNMGASAKPMFGMMRGVVQPADGTWSIEGGKLWFIKETANVRNVNEAIQPLVIPSLQEELMRIIELGMKMMEDATGVSYLIQGQQGSAPDTVGGMQLLHQNASSLLRRIARTADDSLITPHIRRYYMDWLMIHGDPEEKGDAMIEAIGSTALVEREIQAMQLPQILELSTNPIFEKSPKKVFDEILRAWRFDPGRFDMDEDEKQAMQEQMAQGEPPAPQVQAAQIRAQAELEKEQIRAQASVQKMQLDTDRDTVHVQSQTQRIEIHQAYMLEKIRLDQARLEIDERLALLKYANDREISLEKAKTELAKAAMKIQSVKELASMEARERHMPAKPPIEPPGKAPAGESWQK